MQLIICEKPKVAEKVASALGNGKYESKAKGQARYYELERGGQKIRVAAAVGHIFSLRQKEKGGGYPVFDIEWAPSHEVSEGSAFTKQYLTLLESLSSGCKEFVNSCDYDLEGSLIGYNVIRFACESEHGKRMKFSALTEEDLIEAYETMEDLDYNNVLAAEARHMLDWYYGINLSRALMHAVRAAGTYKVLSIGRVQGPALSILSKREREIIKFVPEPYWLLYALVKKTKFLHSLNPFKDQKEAEQRLALAEKDGTVEKVEKKEFPHMPNPPFDLTSLQVEAYRCLGFPPALTLQLAQSLYEDSLISYPRTSSQKLPKKLNFQKIFSGLEKNAEYSSLVGKLKSQNRFTPLEGQKSDPAHPAIHPTGLSASMDPKAGRLYDLICRRFLACFAENAKRESQKIVILFGSERFSAGGIRTVYPGWFEFYASYVKLEDKELPEFKEGEKVHATSLDIEQKETKPPSRYTPASIIQALESKDLGTKATRSVIIETLYKRGYVADVKIKVTDFGLTVEDTLSRYAPEILDEELTRKFESEMEGIQSGDTKEEQVLKEGREILAKILGKMQEKESDIGKELVSALRDTEQKDRVLGECPNCKGNLVKLWSRAKKPFVGCSGYPNCRNMYPLPQRFPVKPTGGVCQFCKTPIVTVFMGRRKFDMCLKPDCESKKDWNRRPASAKAEPTKEIPAQDNVEKPLEQKQEVAQPKAKIKQAKKAPKAKSVKKKP
jgi:DNA topoisomerase I